MLLLLAAINATALASPSRRDLFPGVETRYRQIVAEMRAGPSLLVPALEGRPYSDKPPLHFWLVVALTLPFGLDSTWPFVIPSLLSFAVMQLLVRRLARDWFGGDGLLAVLVFATFSLAWGLAQGARMDMGFTLAITAAIVQVSRFRRQGQPGALLAAAALTGLAVLVKGPMAWPIVAAFLALQMKAGETPAPALSWRLGTGAAALSIAIPLAWILPAVAVGGRDYARALLVHQTLGRAFDAWENSQPVWWYLQRFPATLYPWLGLALVATIAAFVSRRAGESSCLHGLAAVLLPYSLISGKLDIYLLPALAPLALLAAHLVESRAPDRWTRWASAGNIATIAIVGLVATLGPYVSPLASDHLPPLEGLAPAALAGLAASTAILAGAVLVALKLLARRLSSDGYPSATTVAVALVTFYPQAYFTFALLPAMHD